MAYEYPITALNSINAELKCFFFGCCSSVAEYLYVKQAL